MKNITSNDKENRLNILFVITYVGAIVTLIHSSKSSLSITIIIAAFGFCLLPLLFGLWYNLLKKESKVKSNVEKFYFASMIITLLAEVGNFISK